MSSPAYLMPMLLSVLVISASVYSSKRFVSSSVKITNGAGVWAASQQSSLSRTGIGYSPGNEGSRCSCTAPSSAERRGGT